MTITIGIKKRKLHPRMAPKFNSSPPKNDGWKMIFTFSDGFFFRGKLAVKLPGSNEHDFAPKHPWVGFRSLGNHLRFRWRDQAFSGGPCHMVDTFKGNQISIG